jgi:hypothetical protein
MDWYQEYDDLLSHYNWWNGTSKVSAIKIEYLRTHKQWVTEYANGDSKKLDELGKRLALNHMALAIEQIARGGGNPVP